MHVTSSALVLILITLLAATVNGALGYGFSSITVPIALLLYTNRVLNPVLVWIEVLLNAYVLWVNRKSVPLVWRRVAPIICGLAPGVIMGTALVHRVQPGWLKLDSSAGRAFGARKRARDRRRIVRARRSRTDRMPPSRPA